MKAKFNLTDKDREEGFEKMDEYTPYDITKYPNLSRDILEGHRNKIDNINIDSLRIKIYGEGLVLPTYITEDIYSKVEKLINEKYSFLEDYKGDMALIAEYLKRYNDNSETWSSEFLKNLKGHYKEVEKAKKLFAEIQKNGIIGGRVSIECFSAEKGEIPVSFKTKDNALIKMILQGFINEFYDRYIQTEWFDEATSVETLVQRKIFREYQTPMLKAYFEMLYNEGISSEFGRKTPMQLLFGELGEIAGAFVYDPEATNITEEDRIKAITEEEKEKLKIKEQRNIRRQQEHKLESRVEDIGEPYKAQMKIDITAPPIIKHLEPVCTLREYILYNNISVDKLNIQNYISAAVWRGGKYLYDRDKLDALFK